METVRGIVLGHDACSTLALGLLVTVFARPLLERRPRVVRAGAAVWLVAMLLDFGLLCDQYPPGRAGDVLPLAVTACVVGYLAASVSWLVLGALALAREHVLDARMEADSRRRQRGADLFHETNMRLELREAEGGLGREEAEEPAVREPPPAKATEPKKPRAERMQEIVAEYEAEKALAEKLPEGEVRDTALSAAEGRMRRRMAELE